MKGVEGGDIGEHFRKRITEEVEALVIEREGDSPEAQLRARLASGVIALIMDTSREHWLQTGSTEALPEVGQRCMSTMQQLLTIHIPAPK